MKTIHSAVIILTVLLTASASYARLYGDPPDARHAYQVHDDRRPRPDVITPGKHPGDPPSDAVVLFDGTDLSKWEADKREKGVPVKGVPSKWRIVDGVLESVKRAGYIRTKQAFGDCQLHVEWATPVKVEGSSQQRGNSGVFLMGLYEVQVLDCYKNDTYPDGQAGSVYGQNDPLWNVCRGPGQWQSYDIIFRRPHIKDGELIRPGYLTVFQNGVVIQDHWILEGPTGHRRRTKLRSHPDKLPFKIQDHGNPVRFRNIWIRELPERSNGRLKGPYTDPKAVQAKRVEIAQQVRQEAEAASDQVEKMQLLLESLAYEECPDTEQAARKMLNAYLAPLKGADKQAVEKQKVQIIALRESLTYLTKHEILAKNFGPKLAVDRLVEKHELNKRR